MDLNENSTNYYSLLEATSYVLFPGARYFLRFLPLVYIGDTGDAIYAEHTWSLIVASYTWYGGLNGVIGGDKGMETRLQRQSKKETFRNGPDFIVLQGHVPDRYKETEQSGESMKFYAEFSEDRGFHSRSCTGGGGIDRGLEGVERIL
jgi:hypothetical protein